MRWADGYSVHAASIRMARDFKKALRKTARKIRRADGMEVSAGIFAGATYPDTGQSVAKVALINEFGAPAANIPARPFMRIAIARSGDAWLKGLTNSFFHGYLASGDYTLEDVGTIVGRKMEADIKEVIDIGVAPDNKPATKRKKQRKDGTIPGTLRDTFIMRNAITYDVKVK
nr:MAG TPA: virion morphogenesis protein [Caudoviricetes sp.]